MQGTQRLFKHCDFEGVKQSSLVTHSTQIPFPFSVLHTGVEPNRMHEIESVQGTQSPSLEHLAFSRGQSESNSHSVQRPRLELQIGVNAELEEQSTLFEQRVQTPVREHVPWVQSTSDSHSTHFPTFVPVEHVVLDPR